MTTTHAAGLLVPGVEHLTPLKAGGFGTVYRGYQPRFDRWIAVKVVTSKEPEAVRVRHFERECAILGRLCDHPNVLRVFESGYLHGGLPYLITELCPDGSLADRRSRGGPLGVDEVILVGRRIGAVLQHLHQSGILHRDVTPANILRRADGEPVLADFGLAVRRNDSDTGPTAASPGHAAPEVLAAGAWSTAADVYALGSTLRSLLPEPAAASPAGLARSPGLLSLLGLLALLEQLHAADARSRPSAGEVVARLESLAATQPRSPATPSTPPIPAVPAIDPDVPWSSIWDKFGAPAEADQPTQFVPTPPAPSRKRLTRRRLMACAGALVLVAALAAAAVLTGLPSRLVGGWDAARRPAAPAVTASPGPIATATPTTPPTVPPTVPPSAPPPASATPPAAALPPAGYALMRGSQGMVVPVPAGWSAHAVAGTAELRAYGSRNPDRFVQFGGYRPGHASQLGRVRDYAIRRRVDYHELKLTPVHFGRASEAVDWEYTYRSGGTTRHAYGRYWRLGSAEYVVYANAPQGQWPATLPLLQVMIATVTPR